MSDSQTIRLQKPGDVVKALIDGEYEISNFTALSDALSTSTDRVGNLTDTDMVMEVEIRVIRTGRIEPAAVWDN